MTLTLSYEDKRDLLTGMLYKRSNTQVASRSYTYDTLGRPTSRGTMRDGQSVSDSFAYNNRSELTTATVPGESYVYDYDNIGNRAAAVEDCSGVASRIEYETNHLNQYTAIGDFVPTFDDAGNQTLVKTSTGIWIVTYDAENRPTLFSNADGSTTVECTYDYMGRRATKKVTLNGSVMLHQRYIYRGYLQIASCDLTRTAQTALWLLTWDPTQTTATRPLAIQINGTWFTYGWDLTKNICEVYGQHGYIRTAYTYTPYGSVTMSGDLIQPIQWSSEYHDTELALMYYNYRHYNPTDGRWLGRDRINNENMYEYVNNNVHNSDIMGLLDSPMYEKYKNNWRYMYNRWIATFLYYPKSYDANNPNLLKGWENSTTFLMNEIKNRNKLNTDTCGRQCYQFDVYERPLTLEGLYMLPWAGYDKAVLITHSEYIHEELSYYDTGIYAGGSDKTIKIQVGQPNVEVFGCHLSGRVNGTLYFKEEVIPLILQYLDNFKPEECCEKVTYIQIVSNRRNTNDILYLE